MMRFLPFFLIALVFSSATCKDKTDPKKEGDNRVNLLDSKWYLESLSLAGKRTPIFDATLTIHGEKLTGHGGCNSFRSSYKATGNDITIAPIGATKKYCGAASKFEKLFFNTLQTTLQYVQEKDKLILTSKEREIVFSTKPPISGDPKELIGDWLLTRFQKEDMLFPLPSGVTAKFDGKKLTGFGGCNNYFGSFSISGNQFKISNIGATEMYCDKASKFEQRFFKELSKVNSYRILNNKLEIFGPSSTLLTFRKRNKKGRK